MTDKDLPTRLLHLHAAKGRSTVNPPVERASTLVFSNEDALYGKMPTYGRMGLGVHRELSEGLCALESAEFAQLAPTGLAACALALASSLSAGDHLLFSDTVYGPTRRFCERRLKAMGVSATRFAPREGADIARLIRKETRAIFLESPGSLTFEIIDTPAIVELARVHGLITIMDNTWSAGLFHKPLELGVDVSLQALTKYVVGHSDIFGGAVMSSDKARSKAISDCATDWGISLGPDDAYAALRGLRTLPTRLAVHERSAIAVAKWLEAQPWVQAVLHPALQSHPDHDIWARDFTGSSGLFGLIIEPLGNAELKAAFDRLSVFRMGFSWGGFESLLIPCDRQLNRSEGDWTKSERGQLLRLHIGLETEDDLIRDLDGAFSRPA